MEYFVFKVLFSVEACKVVQPDYITVWECLKPHFLLTELLFRTPYKLICRLAIAHSLYGLCIWFLW